MRSYLVLDVETTISNKGNPFDRTNKLCYVGLKDWDLYDIEYSDEPYKEKLDTIQRAINEADVLVGFNIKFDLHWLRRYGIVYDHCRIHDCQLVHFMLTGQQESYPSLNGVASYYSLGSKLDKVADEYWKHGIDTPDIPREILEEYLQQDLDLTEQVYLKQLEDIENNPQIKRLISLHNQDLLVLEEMESNGIIYDEEQSKLKGDELEREINKLDEWLFAHHNCVGFNPNSTDHLSAFLYGGSIVLRHRVACGVFKTGTRAGQTKERWEDYTVEFPRLINPLRGSELQKEGLYSTDEATLKSLRGSKKAKEIVETLLFRSTLEKRLSTYYQGLVNLINQMNWDTNMIYGQLNQCVARTGRLSSSKPNLQNFDGEIKSLFLSRYD